MAGVETERESNPGLTTTKAPFIEQAQSEGTRVLLDLDAKNALRLALQPGWSIRVIRAVGNYGEIFDRNLGAQSPLKIKRGLNALWNNGGLLYAPPIR